MSTKTAIYKTAAVVGAIIAAPIILPAYGIVEAFNWASGNNALKKRGLERPNQDLMDFPLNFIPAIGFGVICVAPFVMIAGAGPSLTLLFSAAAAVVETFIPPLIQAGYLINEDGKAKAEREKTLKRARQAAL